MSKVKLDMAYGTIRIMESQLAALREELEQANRDRDCEQRAAIDAHKRLADAERRNAVCTEPLDEVLNEVPHGWGESFGESELAERIRAALNKPEEAKS